LAADPDCRASDTTAPEAPTGLKVSLDPEAVDVTSNDKTRGKVFILAGQPNMIGAGTVTPASSHLDRNGGMGTLQYRVNDPSQSPTYDHLLGDSGQWAKRDEVWIVDLNRSGPRPLLFQQAVS
jgi:hypothetical protein